ncbi:glucose dehydrogenase [bacterium]|nr:glucose dehydrogenase [bacterium]
MLPRPKNVLATFVFALLICFFTLPDLYARSFRLNQVPNASTFGCNACHTSGGGSPRNAFGLTIENSFLINGDVDWGAALAAIDSDGDGFTNGEELGDPDGDGTPDPNAQVTHPGDADSFPQIEPTPEIELELIEVADGLASPVAGAHAGDNSGRLFICEQAGRIFIIQNDELMAEPFLDIRNKVVNLNSGYDERGLLGLAFHPNFETNQRFFVYYSAPTTGSGNHKSIVAEYTVSSGNTNQANIDSERILMEIEQPEGNHDGGQLAFGPDGYLYIGLGDGGGANDRHGAIGNGQDTSTLLGSILRMDVNSGDPYAIPSDNPFVGQDGRDEIWAYGLRNPWKFSFDRGGEHRLFCGDVGQNEWEEVNIIEQGGNYGWRVMEGTHCFNPSTGCDKTGKILPIAEYSHDVGISVIGGYVYRRHPDSILYGKYVFGDWNGALFYLNEEANWEMKEFGLNTPLRGNILAFAENELGDIYVLTSVTGGPSGSRDAVYKLSVVGEELAVPQWQKY